MKPESSALLHQRRADCASSSSLHSFSSPQSIPSFLFAILTPISVYCDIDTDIGADFNDARYRCTPDMIGLATRAGQTGWPVWFGGFGAAGITANRGRGACRTTRMRHTAPLAATRQHGSTAARQHGSMAACAGSMAVVQHCRSAARQDGSIAAWQDGSTASRHHGRHHSSMATLQHGSTPALQLQCSMPHSLSSAACKRKFKFCFCNQNTGPVC